MLCRIVRAMSDKHWSYIDGTTLGSLTAATSFLSHILSSFSSPSFSCCHSLVTAIPRWPDDSFDLRGEQS